MVSRLLVLLIMKKTVFWMDLINIRHWREETIKNAGENKNQILTFINSFYRPFIQTYSCSEEMNRLGHKRLKLETLIY